MDEPRRKRGRPPKSPDERRATVLQIMLTETERDLLDRVSQGEGGTSTWAREILLVAARRVERRAQG